MIATLHIQLLGDFRLVYGDAVVTEIHTARLQSLLAYLVLQRDAPQSRQQLAFHFWPDSTEAQARNNLRQALHQLRHALPQPDRFLAATVSTLRWRPDAPFSLDVADFERALAAADAAQHATDPIGLRAALERALALYQGDLLPSCYDDWIAPERERLQQCARRALERLIQLLEEQHAYAAAIPFAQRLLRLDPLHEETALWLMRLHARNHDRAAALRVYHAQASLLERELGIEPGPALRAAYTRLMAGDEAPLWSVAPALAPLPAGMVTFLFTDIEDSTRLWEQHPQAMPLALARHHALLREAIAAHDGVIFQIVGDAVYAAFPSAADAIGAALAGQRALRQAPWGATGPLRVRMALHSATIAPVAGAYPSGPHFNRLARILATGHGGQLLLSQATADLARAGLPPEVTLRDLGRHRLKGFAHAEPILQLVAADLLSAFPPLASSSVHPGQFPASPTAPAPSLVGQTPLVGRGQEWAWLQEIWQLASAGGPRMVVLRGEAGIGKSRLAEELLAWVDEQGFTTAKTRAYAAEGRLAYGPVVEWLRSDRLRASVARLEPVWLTELARLLPELLAERPDLPRPEPLAEYWQRQRFFEALARAVLHAPQPLLLLFDDLQWCDPETLEWLHYLLRFDPRARLLVAGTARAEEVDAQHPLTPLLYDLHRSGQLAEIELRPLDAAETAALTARVAGRAFDDEQIAQLYRETEGNPLFVLETIRAGFGSPAFRAQRAEPGNQIDARSRPWSAQVALPPKVHAVIAARLAQLSASARELAALAATIGRAFTFEVLAHASQYDEDSLVRALDELWQRRIVREQGAQTYDFSHDKLREVASAEISPMHRQLIHRRVARALETVYASNLDPVSLQVAAHYERAGLPEQAIQHYQRAAAVAQRIYANEEAISLLNKALALLQRLPPGPERDAQELALQTTLGVSVVAVRGHGDPEVIDICRRAQELCQRLGKPPEPPILRALAIAHLASAEFQQSRAIGDQLLSMAVRDQDAVLFVEAHYVLGVTLFWQGEFTASRKHFEQAMAYYDPQQSRTHIALYSQDPKVICLCRLALDLWYLGYPDQAIQTMQKALALAQELAHPFSRAYAGYFDTLLQNHRREVQETDARAEAVIALCREHRLGYWLQLVMMLQGWARAEQGDVEAGIAQIYDGMSIYSAIGIAFVRPYYMALLAEQHGRAGAVEQGLALLAEALEAVDKNGDHWCAAELYRTKGTLLLMSGEESEAAAAFERAIVIARAQQAKSLELRAATSLARLWQRQGKGAEARRMLEQIYGWFSEGFDTADLQAARALLEQLRIDPCG